VTTLVFKHKYAKIDIYHSFTQDHTCNWASMYKFTKTVDENKVEHYRYILNSPSLQTLSINGKYTIGDKYTGIKEFSYNCPDIKVKNGRHAIVYTYRMDERCAIDLGLPSGVKWSPINLGVESSNCMADTYMSDSEIAAAINKLGKRLAWGELFEKDSYSIDTYIDDKWSIMPEDITETVYDAAKQLWGGHWSMPSAADINELIAYTEELSRETIHSDEIDRDINKITLRSKINGKEITFLTNGFMNGSSIVNPAYLYYMSASRTSYAGNYTSLYSPTETKSIYRPYGCCIRPVLKELYIYPDDKKKDIIVSHIDALAVDLGITKTVTETINGVEQEVTYKLLWSPFNYGVESKVDLKTYNGVPINEDYYISLCTKNLGMRLAWGDTEEPASFHKPTYNNSAIGKKYPWVIANNDTDARNLNKEDDIVQLNWPSGWYIPTAKDFEELKKNTTITKETIDGHNWFRLTGKNGNSILIPATNFIDNADNTEKWSSDTYLQSCTIGPSGNEPKQYALNINSDGKASLASGAGRATGLMIRPVKYVRVQK
ncbi:MAG: hypothetical protein SPG55_05410, partial [Prevotella sp.]|nr:hypothetical protein [Prevotellaceae bacterium]MDY5343631.1 hypothetical protein [Prevotella sp.]